MDPKPRAAIEAEVAKIKGSKAFARSRMKIKLLDFLIIEALDGRQEALNEYLLAEKVYDLDMSKFDPGHNTRVRQGASELREKLDEYYKDEGSNDPCIIDIVGYVPRFRFPQETAPPANQPDLPATANSKKPRWSWVWKAALGALPVAILVTVILLLPGNSECRITSPSNGAVVGPKGTVAGTGCPSGLNHYLIVEPLDNSGQRWSWGKVESGPWTKNGVEFGRADTPSGLQFRIYVLSTKSELPRDELKEEPENPKLSPAITVTLVKPTARNGSGAGEIPSDSIANGATPWVRISDISGLHMEKQKDQDGATVQRLEGTARGAISRSDASVFLLWRAARQCFHRSSSGSGLKGAPVPDCDERSAPDALWNVRETVVDASGNWSATIGPTDQSFGGETPWVEFWQLQAVATFERQAFADRITPFGTLATSIAREIPHLVCSEPRIFSYSEVFSGFWRGFEPTGMPGFC